MSNMEKINPLGDLSQIINAPQSHMDTHLAVTIRQIPAMVQLFAKHGQSDTVLKKLDIKTLPSRAGDSKILTALPTAPSQWLLVSKELTESDFAPTIENKINNLGYVSEQSDSRICIRVSGKKAHELMSRGCRLDLHPMATNEGFCAQTNMAQIGVLIHQVDNKPTYDLFVYSGFARSFWHWITETAKSLSPV